MTDLLDIAARLEAACDITGKPTGRHMVTPIRAMAADQMAYQDKAAQDEAIVRHAYADFIDNEAKLFDALAIVAKEAVEALRAVEAEKAFLLARAANAGSFSLRAGRWTGISSNALVAVAFGGEDDSLPSDGDDLAACYRTIMRLPAHLVSNALMDQLRRGEQNVGSDGVAWAQLATGWIEWTDGAIPS